MDRRWPIALAIAAAAVGAGVWFGAGVRVPSQGGGSVTSPAAVPTVGSLPASRLVVHVAGWVARPGLVELAAGSRVGDAVAAAGGAKSGADLRTVNLAQAVVDGQQVLVPGPEGMPGTEVRDHPVEDGLVHLNSAEATVLEQLPGVGPVLAERIVAHRDEMGPFETVEDLLEVSGIGEAKLASIRDFVAVP